MKIYKYNLKKQNVIQKSSLVIIFFLEDTHISNPDYLFMFISISIRIIMKLSTFLLYINDMI